MKDLLTTLLDLIAAGLVIAGVALVSVPAAMVIGGLALLAVSWKASL